MSLPKKLKESALFSAAEAITKNNQEKLQEIQDYRAQKIQATAKQMYIDDHKQTEDQKLTNKQLYKVGGAITSFGMGPAFLMGSLSGSFELGMATTVPGIAMGGMVATGIAAKDAWERKIGSKKASKAYDQLSQSNNESDISLINQYKQKATEQVDQRIGELSGTMPKTTFVDKIRSKIGKGIKNDNVNENTNKNRKQKGLA